MKKISSMSNSLYRLELVSGNKLQKMFTICHMLEFLSYTAGVVPSPPPPSPFSRPTPWWCRHHVPLEKDTISTVKTL